MGQPGGGHVVRIQRGSKVPVKPDRSVRGQTGSRGVYVITPGLARRNKRTGLAKASRGELQAELFLEHSASLGRIVAGLPDGLRFEGFLVRALEIDSDILGFRQSIRRFGDRLELLFVVNGNQERVVNAMALHLFAEDSAPGQIK